MFNIHEYERRIEEEKNVLKKDKKYLREKIRIKRKYYTIIFTSFILGKNDELCKNYRHRIGSFIKEMIVDPKL